MIAARTAESLFASNSLGEYRLTPLMVLGGPKNKCYCQILVRWKPMSSSDTGPACFLTTHWSLIFAARESASTKAAMALDTLCRAYWYPLYAYARRTGYGSADAKDLTQEFFARLLAKNWLSGAAPERGRFRTFLLVAMKRLLAGEWQRARTQKRGSGQELIPLPVDEAEARYAIEPALGADEIFERRWAMTLLEQTLARLKTEYEGREDDYHHLCAWLTAARGEIPYAQIASQLAISEGAARVAIHRLRKRFRALFRETIAQTVPAEDVDEEMRHTARVLSALV